MLALTCSLHGQPLYPREHLDLTVSPAQDFHQYAIGGYLRTHPVRGERGTSGPLYEAVRGLDAQVDEVISTAARRPGDDVGDFYNAALQVDEAGLQDLEVRAGLQRISDISSYDELVETVAHLHRVQIPVLFGLGAFRNPLSTEEIIVQAFQGAPPARIEEKKRREAYLQHVGTLLKSASWGSAVAAPSILQTEARLAAILMQPAEFTAPGVHENVWTRSRLRAEMPRLRWDRYFETLGYPDVAKVNLASLQYFTRLNHLLESIALDDWRHYLAWRFVRAQQDYLPIPPFEEKPRSSEQRARSLVRNLLPAELSRAFVEKHLIPGTREAATAMGRQLQSALRDSLERAPWLSQETRAEAVRKSDLLVLRIGYPEVWTDEPVRYHREDSFLQNVARLRLSGFVADMDRTRGGTTSSPWPKTLFEWNASYEPEANTVNLPAANLQFLFAPGGDLAMNYGAVGTVLAHEMCHAFDPQGSRRDARGNVRDWWSESSRVRFEALEKQLSHQFGAAKSLEMMAELGGLELAYDGLQRALRQEGASGDAVGGDGFTSNQRFFLAYALSRGGALGPKLAEFMKNETPYPLPADRVNGILANFRPFAAAFAIQPGSPMARGAQGVSLWGF